MKHLIRVKSVRKRIRRGIQFFSFALLTACASPDNTVGLKEHAVNQTKPIGTYFLPGDLNAINQIPHKSVVDLFLISGEEVRLYVLQMHAGQIEGYVLDATKTVYTNDEVEGSTRIRRVSIADATRVVNYSVDDSLRLAETYTFGPARNTKEYWISCAGGGNWAGLILCIPWFPFWVVLNAVWY